jgi:hypothetical protein
MYPFSYSFFYLFVYLSIIHSFIYFNLQLFFFSCPSAPQAKSKRGNVPTTVNVFSSVSASKAAKKASAPSEDSGENTATEKKETPKDDAIPMSFTEIVSNFPSFLLNNVHNLSLAVAPMT